MPLYEYRCGKCSKLLEVLQNLSDPPLEVCPHCGGALKKQISSPAIQFKGSGFYLTDYARSSSPGTSSSEKSGSDGGSETASSPAPSKTPSE